MKKRFLSVLTALCLALSLLPVSALAEGTEGPEPDVLPVQQDLENGENEAAVPASTEDACAAGTCDHVADIAGTHYDTLQAAVDAAGTGETTITMLKNDAVNGSLTIPAGKEIILDMAENEFTGGNKQADVYAIVNHGDLTIRDGTVRMNGDAGYGYYGIESKSDGVTENGIALTLENVSIIQETGDPSGATINTVMVRAGSATIDGGTYHTSNMYSSSGTPILVVSGEFVMQSGKNFYDAILSNSIKNVDIAATSEWDAAAGRVIDRLTEPAKDPAAELAVGGQSAGYASFESALDAWAANGGTLKMLQPYTHTGSFSLVNAGDYVLDLNGKTFTLQDGKLSVGSTNTGGPVVNLTVKDSSQDGKLYLTGAYPAGSSATSGSMISVNRNSAFVLESGTIQAGQTDLKSGLAVIGFLSGTSNNGRIEIKGGEIEISSSDISSYGLAAIPARDEEEPTNQVEITGGTFSNTANVEGYVPDGYTLEGGTVKPNTTGSGDDVAAIDGQYFKTLQGAVNAAGAGDTVKLLKDATESITVPAGKNIVLDLQGNTVTSADDSDHAIVVEGQLTVKDSTTTKPPEVGTDYEAITYTAGTIQTTEETSNSNGYWPKAVQVQNGGSFELKSGILYSADSDALFVVGNMSGTQPIVSSATVSGGYIHSDEYGIGVVGAGAVLNMKGGVVAADNNAAIGGNGSTNQGGTEINISGGTIIGHIDTEGYVACGVYHPQQGTLKISGGTIYADGGVGVLMRGGTMEMTDGTIIATGNATGGVGDSNVRVGCYGVQIDGPSDYYDYDNCKASISGGDISSDTSVSALKHTDENGIYDKFSVTGGTFSSEVDPAYCAVGYVPAEVEGGSGYTVEPVFASGTGTEEDPYIISTVEQLQKFAASVNSGADYDGLYIALDPDATDSTFNLSGITAWTPIGTAQTPFSGHVDGNKKPITGLKIGGAADDSYIGFFGHLSGATVEDVNIVGAEVTCNQDNWVGVLAGRADSSVISGCTVSGKISVNSSSPATMGIAAAGLVEYLGRSTVQDSTTDVDINVSTSAEIAYAGGIACEVNDSTINNCTNKGDISGYSTYNSDPYYGYSYVGGIAAYMKNGSTIQDCTNTGAVTSGDAGNAVYATAGGILGQIWAEMPGVTELVTGCTNSGSVTAAVNGTDSYAGGIVGETYQYATQYELQDGKVVAKPWTLADHSDLTISGCSSTGTVTAGTAASVLAWGDAEWNLNLTGNTGAQPQAGSYGIPAEVTIASQADYESKPSENSYGYEHYFVAIETIRFTGAISDDAITLEDGQTLIIEAGASFTGTITVKPGATLIQNGTVDGNVETASGSYLITFKDGETTLGQIATESDGTILFPEDPTRTGYTFDGWYNDEGSQVSSGAKATEAMTLTARWSQTTSGSGSSGGTRYSVSVEDTSHGEIRVSPSRASRGQTVTITVDPDEGYELDELVVLDSDGDEIDVKRVNSTRYTFEMPRGAVTVEASFARETVETTFDDVGTDYWAYDEIEWAYDSGYMNGTSASTFAPGSSISRQQVWMILARMSGADPASMAEARQWAMENDISDGTNPGSAVTRQQLAALLFRFAQSNGYDDGGRKALTSFPDAGSVSAYAVEPLQWATAGGIIGGTSAGTLNPTGSATRAQFAVMLYRFWNQVG